METVIEGVQRGWPWQHGEGDGGGTKRAAAAAWREWWQWHVEGGGNSGMETAMGVVQRWR